MPFKLLKDAKPWFRDVREELSIDFDVYYFCLIAGLAAGRKRLIVKGEDASDLVQDFPGDYRSRGRLLVALLLTRELRSLGINFNERTVLHKEISKIIDPLSASHLSAVGLEEMNKYSYGGFDVLTEWFEDRPRFLEVFLPKFVSKVRSALSDAGE